MKEVSIFGVDLAKQRDGSGNLSKGVEWMIRATLA